MAPVILRRVSCLFALAKSCLRLETDLPQLLLPFLFEDIFLAFSEHRLVLSLLDIDLGKNIDFWLDLVLDQRLSTQFAGSDFHQQFRVHRERGVFLRMLLVMFLDAVEMPGAADLRHDNL